jgi:hypothetical protein
VFEWADQAFGLPGGGVSASKHSRTGARGSTRARSKAHQAHLFLGRLVAVRPGAEALAFLLSWSGPWGIKARLLSCRLYGTGYCNYMRRRCLLCVFGWPLVVSQQATHGHVDRHGWGIPIFLLHGTVTKNIDVTTFGHYSLLSLRRDSSHERDLFSFSYSCLLIHSQFPRSWPWQLKQAGCTFSSYVENRLFI